ncbi:anti-sigma factor antagonist [Desulfonema ishimotonii]|uniref:Anti-sigma factor antagonist n=1 Tax=Desulfonema ishimotonii TaxID=45657 RepID=A0A401FTS3_9BACT|nr:STAS domain-containing protein [Desulfonema ishimotonii]GBC60355.1 anti-sigma factor antagonist [Desulfonema ishimotonii]
MRLLEDEKHGDIRILRMLEDRLDAAISEKFKAEMGRHIDENPPVIVLNLAKIKFMDSSGLGAIISGRKKMGPDTDLVLCCMGEMVTKLFRLTRMHRVFKMYATEDEAIAALSE